MKRRVSRGEPGAVAMTMGLSAVGGVIGAAISDWLVD